MSRFASKVEFENLLVSDEFDEKNDEIDANRQVSSIWIAWPNAVVGGAGSGWLGGEGGEAGWIRSRELATMLAPPG